MHASESTSRSITVVLAAALGLACGPTVQVEPEDDTTTNAPSDTTTASPPDDESGPPPPTTGVADSTGGEESSTGIGFLDHPDGGGGWRCDLFAQDCPPGEKCMPWANDGGSTWNATRCSPIAEDPGGPGDPCTVEGSAVSGVDDCELGAMCWDVDPETLEGYCIALCRGDSANPTCDDPDYTCVISAEGVIVPCLLTCDPLEGCPRGQLCVPQSNDWLCAPDASEGMGGYGAPCEFINVCNPGLVCLDASVIPGCPGPGCCTEVCDLDAPVCTGAPEGQECLPWYEPGTAPAGLENVGVCAVPM